MRTPVDAEQAADVVGVGEELSRRAGMDDLSRVEHDDVAGEALERWLASAPRSCKKPSFS